MSYYPQGGWMPDDLPHLPTYAQARAHYDRTIPYAKGSEVGYRPLGAKRKYTRSLILAEADTFMLSYYNNIVVKLYESGKRGFSICGFPTISTTCFLNETSRTDNLHFQREKGKIYAVYKGTFYRMPNRGYVEISANGAISGYERETQHAIDFDGIKAVREKYAPFTTYFRDMLTISPHVEPRPNTEGMHWTFVADLDRVTYMPSTWGKVKTERNVKQSMTMFFELLDKALEKKESDRLNDFFHLAIKFLNSCIMENTHRFTDFRVVEIANAQNHFNELIKYRFAKQVFKQKEVAPRDRAVHDSNEHYMALGF